jgi:hypothetical protein
MATEIKESNDFAAPLHYFLPVLVFIWIVSIWENLFKLNIETHNFLSDTRCSAILFFMLIIENFLGG